MLGATITNTKDTRTAKFDVDEKPTSDIQNYVDNIMSGWEHLRHKDRKFPTLTASLLYSDVKEKKQWKTPLSPNKCFVLLSTSAVGKFGAYYLGYDTTVAEPVKRTFKVYRPRLMSCGDNGSHTEKQILSMNHKPAVIPACYLGFSYEWQNCLVLEQLTAVSLHEKLMFARRFPPKVTKFFMTEITTAVSFLHSKDLMHSNLTLDAFWIQENGHLKLTGYKGCRNSDSWSRIWPMNRPINNYSAPEFVERKKLGKEVDIWAMGIMLFRMTSGRMPFYSDSLSALKHDICKVQEFYGDYFDIDTIQLCSRLLQKHPQHRLGYKEPTFEALSSQPYFDNVDWCQVLCGATMAPRIPVLFSTVRRPSTVLPPPRYRLKLNSQDGDSKIKLKKKPLRYNEISTKASPGSSRDRTQPPSVQSSFSHYRADLRQSVTSALMSLEENILTYGTTDALARFRRRINRKVFTVQKEFRTPKTTAMTMSPSAGSSVGDYDYEVSSYDEEDEEEQIRKYGSQVDGDD